MLPYLFTAACPFTSIEVTDKAVSFEIEGSPNSSVSEQIDPDEALG